MRISTVPVSLMVLLKNQLRYMSAHFEVVAVSSGGAMLDQLSKDLNMRVKPINMTRKITPWEDFMALTKLVKVMRAEKPLIVHTHTPKAGLLGMLGAKIAGVPIRLHTVAGMPLLERTGFQRRILNAVEKLTYACATMVYPNSGEMQSIILDQKFCNKDKIKVIGNGSSNGVDTDHFKIEDYSAEYKAAQREALNIKPTDFVYCFIGRIVADKGINELVEAFLNINKDNSHTRLLLVGPFENNLDPLKKSTHDSIINNPAIIWIDFQKDVRPYFSISDVFVFPSYREGFPNVVMQAGAMGLPSIVSDINGCNEIIQAGKNGIIVPVKSSIALEKAMLILLTDKQLRDDMSSRCRENIVSRFESSYVMNELLKEYQTQIQKRSAATQTN
ncbi:MAG: glycosyl transferase group 1 [Mucilaginibacter sp.]|nr:glycosyl transferase group 1 [Mucilaginibacter sp.]